MKPTESKTVAENRKARYDYYLREEIVAGLALAGWEVKSAKAGNVSLAESFIQLTPGRYEVWLKNAYFAPYKQGDVREQNTRRNRKLLLHRSEIQKLAKACLQKGSTLVPLRLFVDVHGRLKLVIAVAVGKHAYDKKAVIKQRDIAREVQRILS